MVAAVLILAGCGGGAKATTKVAAVNGHPDPTAIAEKVGCTGYQPDTQTTMFAASTGACDYQGGSVQIDTFASATAESRYQQIADKVGRQGNLIYGTRWAVQADNADMAAAIQAKIGGTIH